MNNNRRIIQLLHHKPASRSKTTSSSTLGLLTTSKDLKAVVDALGTNPTHAFGYGSGCFAQNPTPTPPPMLDLILSTPNPHQFHAQNLISHPHHYTSLMHFLGPTTITALQRDFGASCWFNPLVSITPKNHQPRTIKYGVVHEDDLVLDLKTWSSLYLAGRMMKPIGGVRESDRVREAMNCNFRSATAAGLLLLLGDTNRSKIDFDELFGSIANISYAGDVRMKVGGEDPNKVNKLVTSEGQRERFVEIYRPWLIELEKRGVGAVDFEEGAIRLENSDGCREELIRWLPEGIAKKLKSEKFELNLFESLLGEIVFSSSLKQSCKGVLTAGVMRSAVYAGAKFRKGLEG